MTVIYTLLVAHFLGDFICQTDWMALNKSKRWDALVAHVTAYVVVLIAIIATVNSARAVRGSVGGPDKFFLEFLAVNAVAHFVQDALTSRLTSRLWFVDGTRPVKELFRDEHGEVLYVIQTYEVAYNDKRHWFFVAIGFDQLLHYVTLFVTAGWWLR